jgi:hypothetical protein
MAFSVTVGGVVSILIVRLTVVIFPATSIAVSTYAYEPSETPLSGRLAVVYVALCTPVNEDGVDVKFTVLAVPLFFDSVMPRLASAFVSPTDPASV